MLELRGASSVEGHGRPVVIPHTACRITQGEHRLDGEGHAWHEDRRGPTVVIVRNLQSTVELGPDSVPDELTDHSEAVATGMAFDSPANGVHRLARSRCGNPLIHGHPGLSDQATVSI